MNSIKQFSDRIDKKLFGRNFSSIEGMVLVGFTLGALTWIPMVVLPYLNEILSCLIFAILYFIIVSIVYMINGKILASKQYAPSILLKSTCVALVVLFVILVSYLYSFKILLLQDSLWVMVPVSVVLSNFCVFVWSRSKNS